jgi:hypothetical protein
MASSIAYQQAAGSWQRAAVISCISHFAFGILHCDEIHQV